MRRIQKPEHRRHKQEEKQDEKSIENSGPTDAGSAGAGGIAAAAELESRGSYDTGGVTLNYSPSNRIGSRYVEVTVIGSTGKLLK